MDAQANPRLRLPARLDSLTALRELALACAARAGLPESLVPRLDLVLEEALMNVIDHAYAGVAGGEGDMELECRAAGPGSLLLILRDWGPAFDPLHQAGLEQTLEANMEAALEDRSPGGMGLFLIRSMAEAGYRREDGANVLSLRIGPGGD